jgi:hypothetical protein
VRIKNTEAVPITHNLLGGSMKRIVVGFLMVLGVFQIGFAAMPLEMSPYWRSTETGKYSTGANWGDIDKNGFLDFAISNGNDMAMAPNYVYFNYGGNLQTTHGWASSNSQYSGHSALGDVNGDGYLDFAVSNYTASGWGKTTVQLYMNIGGSLETSPSWQSRDSMHTFACAFGDVDGDGDLDLAVACGESYNGIYERQRIYYNHGGVLETTPSWTSLDSTPCYDVEWVDVDNDGDLDLAFISSIGPVFIYYNYGTYIEQIASWNSGGYYDGNTLNFGDMDNDGYLDLAVANNDQLGQPGYFQVYQNEGGTLNSTPVWQSSSEGYGSSVSWCDVDFDGDKDLTAGRWWGYSWIYENIGGTLTTNPVWQCSSAYQSVVEEMVWGDVDGDGVLMVKGETHPATGLKKVFYLNHYPAHSLERVMVDGDTLSLNEYCYNLASGWVSVATAPLYQITFDYHYSYKPDLGVSNWDKSNYVFKNIAPLYIWGDLSGDGIVDIKDVIYLINYLFIGGPPPRILSSGDPNNDCVIDVADVVYLVNYLFVSGPPPEHGCE